jgi:Tol biopolymer transport system component
MCSLPTQEDGENAPRWSPDGKYISFVSEEMVKRLHKYG